MVASTIECIGGAESGLFTAWYPKCSLDLDSDAEIEVCTSLMDLAMPPCKEGSTDVTFEGVLSKTER